MENINLTDKEQELDNIIRDEGWIELSRLSNDYAQLSSVIHVDTRDFCINFSFESQLKLTHKNFINSLIKNKSVDYLTFEEVISRLEDWKLKSGGEKEWRLIEHKEKGWFKYIRIFRTEKGFVWCGDSNEEKDNYVFFTNRNLDRNIFYEQY